MDRSSLEIQVERRGPNAVVTLRGSAGMVEAEQLRRQLESLSAQQVVITVLDAGGLEFIGSAGLAAIVHGHLKNRHHGGQIRFVAPPPAVLDVLERTRFTQLFSIHSSVQDALTP